MSIAKNCAIERCCHQDRNTAEGRNCRLDRNGGGEVGKVVWGRKSQIKYFLNTFINFGTMPGPGTATRWPLVGTRRPHSK